MASKETDVLIVGAGIGGLVLAQSLHELGIDCRIYEGVRELQAVGAGINLLPHATRELDALGLVPALDRVGIRTQDASYFNQHGQLIYTEQSGTFAGYAWAQFSLHRGDLQMVLLRAVIERLGADAVVTGQRCVGVELEQESAVARFVDPDGAPLPSVRASVVFGADRIKSDLRKKFIRTKASRCTPATPSGAE